MRKSTVLISSLIFALPFAAAGASPEELIAHIRVDVSQPGSVIDRHIFGQFSEHLGVWGLRGNLGRT